MSPCSNIVSHLTFFVFFFFPVNVYAWNAIAKLIVVRWQVWIADTITDFNCFIAHDIALLKITIFNNLPLPEIVSTAKLMNTFSLKSSLLIFPVRVKI